jgi:ubiquinone/menaquinone biosynthesis C-methylase UbiE
MSHHLADLYDEYRRTWQDPEATLSHIGLEAGFTFMDVGCGDGFFTIPAARFVGMTGKVYGIDVSREAINRLNARAAKEGLTNVHVTVGKAEEYRLCEACADILFFGIVLHDFADPAKVLMNARKMIKPSGRLVNLDWKKEPMTLGPPLQIRFSIEKATRLIREAKFSIETVKEAGSHHYLIIAKP